MLELLLGPLLTSRWAKRSAILINGLLAVFLVWSLIQSVSAWRADWKLVNVNHSAKPSVVSLNEDSATIALTDLGLFGQSESTNPSTLPITSLQLNLMGTTKATPRQFSRAIIAEADEPGKIYHEGDTLSSGVIIHEILKDGVIFDNGGHLETLPLTRLVLEFGDKPKAIFNS